MSIEGPEIPKPPESRQEEINVEKETPTESPEPQPEAEVSHEQVEQHATEAKTEIQQEAA